MQSEFKFPTVVFESERDDPDGEHTSGSVKTRALELFQEGSCTCALIAMFRLGSCFLSRIPSQSSPAIHWNKHIFQRSKYKSFMCAQLSPISFGILCGLWEQSLSLIKYWKGQYIISVTPKIVEVGARSWFEYCLENKQSNLMMMLCILNLFVYAQHVVWGVIWFFVQKNFYS